MAQKSICLCSSMLLSILILNSGCSTVGKSTGLGAGLGGAAGMTAGALADPGESGQNRFRNVIVGTAIGGALGAGAGWMLGHDANDMNKDSYEKGKKDSHEEAQRTMQNENGNQPRLLAPKTEARWVPDQIRGNTFVPGHFEYVIIESAHWDTSR